MIESFLAILAVYVVGALWVHFRFNRSIQAGKTIRHYVLVTENSQTRIERTIRLLLLDSWVHGEAIKITVLDQYSVDDTMRIANRLAVCRFISVYAAQSRTLIDAWLASPECSSDEVTVIELSKCV